MSVVVTTCGYSARLERCLRSILASRHEDFEVVVVDNRPAEGLTHAMLAERFEDELRVRCVEEPRLGLAFARNAGLMAAQGEVVAFTDDDVVVDPGWVGRSAEAFDRDDDVACVTGLILPFQLETDSQLLLEQFAAFSKGYEPRTFRLPDRRHPLLPFTPGLIGSGANIVVRADVARAMGGFDTNLGTGTPSAGGEDLDLYVRLLRAGHAIAYQPSAIVRPDHPDGRRRLRGQVFRYGVGLGATLSKQLARAPGAAGRARGCVPGTSGAAARPWQRAAHAAGATGDPAGRGAARPEHDRHPGPGSVCPLHSPDVHPVLGRRGRRHPDQLRRPHPKRGPSGYLRWPRLGGPAAGQSWRCAGCRVRRCRC